MPPIIEDDFNALLELLGPDTMREVVGLLLESAPIRFASARAGIAEGDHARVTTAFHALRSSCGQLGAKALEHLCTDGERVAKGGDLSAAAVVLDDAEREFARCIGWFVANGWSGAV